MAQHLRKQSEWPRSSREPEGFFVSPDAILKSGRSLVGPLREGTAPGPVGPRGGSADQESDFGIDSVSPRPFDPMGTSTERAPPFPPSRLIRGRRR